MGQTDAQSDELAFEGEPLGSVRVPATGRSVEVTVPLPVQRNGQAYEQLLWSPEHPRLIDARVTLGDDTVLSNDTAAVTDPWCPSFSSTRSRVT